MAAYLVAAFDTYDTSGAVVVTRLVSSAGPLIDRVGGLPITVGLMTPVEITNTLPTVPYGGSGRSSSASGTIVFRVDSSMSAWVGPTFSWVGHPVRLYSGDSPTSAFGDLDLVYTGRISAVDLTDVECSVSVTDASADFDKPLINDLYGDTYPEGVAGYPIPWIKGTVKSIEPVLVDAATQTYQISSAALANTNMTVRVGGVAWKFGASGGGTWNSSFADGKFTLASLPIGEIRVDCRSADYGTMTTAGLIQAVAAKFGASVNAASMAQLDVDLPGLTGYATTITAINAADALDEICQGNGCDWMLNAAGEVVAYAIAAPGTATASANEVNITDFRVQEYIPPAWRIRVEYGRNFAPSTSFLGAVLPEDQARWKAPGAVTPAWSNTTTKAAEAQALDVPLLRSVLAFSARAIEQRDRLQAAWQVPRRIFAISVRDLDVEINDVVQLDFAFFSVTCRVVSLTRTWGGGSTKLQLWG